MVYVAVRPSSDTPLAPLHVVPPYREPTCPEAFAHVSTQGELWRPFSSLPTEILQSIAEHLGVISFTNLRAASRRLRGLKTPTSIRKTLCEMRMALSDSYTREMWDLKFRLLKPWPHKDICLDCFSAKISTDVVPGCRSQSPICVECRITTLKQSGLPTEILDLMRHHKKSYRVWAGEPNWVSLYVNMCIFCKWRATDIWSYHCADLATEHVFCRTCLGVMRHSSDPACALHGLEQFRRAWSESWQSSGS